MCPLPPPHPASPIVNVTHKSGTFVTTGEATLTHHCLPKVMVYTRVTLGVVHFLGLDKSTVTCVHLYSTLHSIFSALKIPLWSVHSSLLALLPSPW